jgi:hypothetical protein
MEKLNHIAINNSKVVRRVSSLEDHRTLLREVFQTAQKRILIVSPFVSKSALHADGIPLRVRAASRRGVKVSVYTDNDLNHIDGSFKRSANDGIAELIRAGASVSILNGVHNKTLIMDDTLISEGSFNWLSAVRTAGGTHQREERTIVVEGNAAKSMIDEEIGKLESKGGGFATIRSDLPESAKARVPDQRLEDNAKCAVPSSLARFAGLAGAWTFLMIVVGGMIKAAGVAMALLLTFVVGPMWLAWRFLRVPVTFK